MCWQRLSRKPGKLSQLAPQNGQVIRWKAEFAHKSREAEDSISTEDNPGRTSRPSMSRVSRQKLLEKLLEKETDSPDNSRFQKRFKTDRDRGTEPRPA